MVINTKYNNNNNNNPEMIIIEENKNECNTHFHFIFLVIASKSDIYQSFLSCWKEYMQNSVQEWNIKCFFVFSDPSISCDLFISNDTIIYKGEENLKPGIFLKTMAALQYCEKKYTYDYILRTNLSSFFYIPRLLRFIENNKTNDVNIYSPVQLISKQHQHINSLWQTYWEMYELYFSTEIINKNIPFLDGACFILSKEIVSILLQNMDNTTTIGCSFIPWYKHLNHTYLDITIIPDDILISMILQRILDQHEFNYKWLSIPITTISNDSLLEELGEDIFFIRNRIDDANNREQDVTNYIQQVRYFYNKTVIL